MLLPTMTDISMPADVAVTGAEAVTEVGGHRHAGEVAKELLSINSYFSCGPREPARRGTAGSW